MPASAHRVALSEYNRRQQMAVDRIELAMGELASVLLSCGRPDGTAKVAIGHIRMAVAPVLAGILTDA